MALGVPGTGPYGRIRTLRQEINDYKYELGLIDQGIPRKLGSKKLKEFIKNNRAEIKKIQTAEKEKKSN